MPQPQTNQAQPMQRTYTPEEIGRRIRERNPDAFSSLNYTDAAIGARAIQRKPELQKIVRQDQSAASTSAEPPRATHSEGALENAANKVNQIYEGYKNLPGVRDITDFAGKVLSVPSYLIGGAVGAVGTPVSNLIQGKPLLQDFKKNVAQNASDTGNFGYNIGREGTAGAPLGVAGKAVTVPLTFAQGYQGYKDVKEGIAENDPAKAIGGGLALGTAFIGGRSAAAERGILLNQGPRSAVTKIAPKTKPLLEPVSTASTKMKGVAEPFMTRVKELPVVKNVKEAAIKTMTGRSNEVQSGVDDFVLNAFEPGATVPRVNAKTGKEIPQSVVESANRDTGGAYQKFQDYRRIADRAVKDPSAPPPLEIAGRKADDALSKYQEKLTKWGELKKKELDRYGDKPVEIAPTTQRLHDDIQGSLGANVTRSPNGEYSVVDAPGRRSKIALDSSDQSLLVSVVNELERLGESNTARMTDDVVDAIQDLLYKRKQNVAVPVNSQVERILKKAVGELNSRLKRTVGKSYTKSNDKYAYFIDTYQKLNKALGQDGSKAASLAKRVFSPTDGGTRALFNQIKRDTGIDLILEARLAKQAGELAGDTRQRGLLESIDQLRPPATAGGVVGLAQKGAALVKKQLADPETIIKRAGQQKRGLRREDL